MLPSALSLTAQLERLHGIPATRPASTAETARDRLLARCNTVLAALDADPEPVALTAAELTRRFSFSRSQMWAVLFELIQRGDMTQRRQGGRIVYVRRVR